MDDVIDHLSDGEPVALPYAYVGHHPAESDAASPVVGVVHSVIPEAHPYRPGLELVIAELEAGGRVAVASDRMAHANGCERCAAIWDRYRGMLVGLPDGAMITAGMEIQTGQGVATLLVDAEDLPEDLFTEGAEDGEG